MKRGAGVVLVIVALAFAARGAVDLVVDEFAFLPEQTETLVNPEQVRFTLGNYGPDTSGYVDVDYVLSRNHLAGEPGHTDAIEVSTNLVHWTRQTNLFNPTGTVQWDDSVPAGSARRFYRALGL